jgi:diguanylate cyclase (GGDEF)-like protein
MKVLVIDDSPEALKIVRARLAKEGLDILCAENGRDGLEAARAEAPDLILLDIKMPDLSGFDVIRRLKADAALAMVPVIFLTGADSRDEVVQGLDLGAVDYVTKPFDAFELRARVRAALRTKHLQDLLAEYAQLDALTELGNRRALMMRLKQEWARIGRYGGRLAFIMADLDHFKAVNDDHGHRVGDRTLRAVADAIRTACRQSDLPVRYGGEEFAIPMPDQAVKGAASLAERCRARIEAIEVPSPEGVVKSTASFGVSDSDGAESVDDLIEQADEALYEAKETGRNRVAVAGASAEAK